MTPCRTSRTLNLMLAVLLLAAGAHSSDSSSTFPILTGPYLGQPLPADTPQLFAPGLISTCKEHSAAMFTPDGTEVWFARLEPSALWYSRLDNGRWTEPQMVPFGEINEDLYPYLSPDGNALYFCSRRAGDTLPALTSRGDGRI